VIQVIDDWGKNMSNTEKVPSTISYTETISGEAQWGYDLSSDALTMVHTKLELDVQDRKSDELEMILHNLDGMMDLDFSYVKATGGKPAYSPKKPDYIAKDYLEKVFKRVMSYIHEYFKGFGLEEADLQTMPVDIVFTVPVNWSYRAKNATYRAITEAGFNRTTFKELRDILLIMEPEAAAVYTARFLKEKRAVDNLLKEGESFVLCDAGGGTVDVVTFRVLKLEPTLELEKIGIGKSQKCGSVFIDGEFKIWLREKIFGRELYEHLEPNARRVKAHSTTGKEMRSIMNEFVAHKRRFTGMEGGQDKFEIDLPSQFTSLPEFKAIDWEGDYGLGEVIQENTLVMLR